MNIFVPVDDDKVPTNDGPNDPDDCDVKEYYGYDDDLDPNRETSDEVKQGKRGRRINVTAEVAPHDLATFRPSRVLFYAPPRQRQRWGDTQVLPRVNWGDLFFDLFYVGATYNVSAILLESPNRRGFLYAAGTFLPVMSIWNEKVLYDARYAIEADVVHRVATIVGLAITGVVISNIRPVDVLADASNQSSIFVFTLMLVVEQLFAMCLFMEVYFRGIGQKQLKMAARRDILYHHLHFPFYFAAMIISAISYFGDGSQINYTFGSSSRRRFLAEDVAEDTSGYTDIPIFLCLLGFLVNIFSFASSIIFCFPGGGRHKEIAVPLNIDFVIHRNGEWMMLMLGESILSLLIVDVDREGREFYTVFYCAILTVILLQLLHFQSQPHEADLHASRRSKNRGVLWSLIQHVYSLFLVTLSSGFSFFLLFSDDSSNRRLEGRLLATEVDEDFVGDEAANIFSVSLALVFLSLDIMSLLHLGTEEIRKRYTVNINMKLFAVFGFTVRLGLILFTATISQWTQNPKHITAIGLLCVCGELATRKFGSLYHRYQQSASDGVLSKEKEIDSPEDDDDSQEASWPNVMHARAEVSMDS